MKLDNELSQIPEEKKNLPQTIEKLWQYLRKHYWANRVYVDYDALRIAAVEAWQKTCLDKGKVKSICRAKYVESEFK